MKATEAKLLEFLKKSSQFVIPIYQRTYSWTAKESRQLWDDVIRTGSDDAIGVHFVGSIVYIEAGQYHVTHQSPLLVIDGQQRLTTLTLLIAALAKTLDGLQEKDREPVDGFSPRKLRNYYLLNPEETGERHYKLILSQTDKPSLISVVGGTDQPTEASLRIVQNYAFFQEQIAACQGELIALCKGLAKLIVVDVALNRDQDNPQLIFESMNSTGRKLSQADLIRNYILMGLEPTIQTRLYDLYWRQMELEFGQEAYGVNFDGFMRHYLTVKTRDIPKLDEIYEKFKGHAREYVETPAGVEALVKDIRHFAKYYCCMALGKERDGELKAAFNDLRELKVDVAYPFLLELYYDYANARLTKVEFVEIVRLAESYVFRRSVCSITPNSMNKTFANFTKALDKSEYLESVRAHFSSLPSYRRFPTDDELRRDLPTRDLYNIPRKSYWLRRLENHGRKELVALEEYTIEHILPQNANLSAVWKGELGPDWQRVQQDWLHTLGNLTLTGYNSEYSDRPFSEKQNMVGGFKHSPLKLNAGLGQVAHWNEDAIRSRAARLTDLALTVWTAPPLHVGEHAKAKAKLVGVKPLTIADHPRVSTGSHQQLFGAFRKEVLALDPCVTEEFFKQYIAFKSETNFVDVEPQAKRLLLTFNMLFSEINDPKGLCRDVTDLGHQGNGDVQIGLSSVDELPYVMGLVRQSFESQMGSSGDG